MSYKELIYSSYMIRCFHFLCIINIKCMPKNGHVVGVLTALLEDEIMAVTKQGMFVRCPTKDIRESGRSTQGVKLISLYKGDEVSSVANVVAKEDDNSSEAEEAA